jgi:predicted DNA-binding protein
MLLRKSKPYAVRLDDVEEEALKELVKHWNTTYAEALRRCVIYTYLRYIEKKDISEENLRYVFLKLKKRRWEERLGSS